VTSFDLNLPAFVDALVSAQKRGVKVRVVIDGKNGTQVLQSEVSSTGQDVDEAQILQKGSVSIVNDGRSNGLMHDKIIIVDGKTLFMGSWNMSYNDTFRNNNNLLIITDPKLVANYQAKFNELFVDKKFGTKAIVKALTPSLNIGGVQVENYFSPPDHVMDKLVAYVQAAKKSVRFMAFTYTSQPLASAMIADAQKGLIVQGVIENRGASQGALPSFTCANVPVKTDGNKYTMHHKVIIIDDQTVITGSFNFTKSADEANDDNVIVIHSPAVAQLYLQEFAKVYQDGKTPDISKTDCSNKVAPATDSANAEG
jgi:phosphatidylserine/phosphatidylglycerophosphate/cardiolipin synthase-like enzyme